MDWDDPKIREVWWDGYAAYQDGLSSYDNPYHADAEPDLFYAWQAGYYEAGWDD